MRHWDLIDAHDSVSLLLVHTGKRALVLVRQFRPGPLPTSFFLRISRITYVAVFFALVTGGRAVSEVAESEWGDEAKARKAITYELCAGEQQRWVMDKMMDKGETVQGSWTRRRGWRRLPQRRRWRSAASPSPRSDSASSTPSGGDGDVN